MRSDKFVTLPYTTLVKKKGNDPKQSANSAFSMCSPPNGRL